MLVQRKDAARQLKIAGRETQARPMTPFQLIDTFKERVVRSSEPREACVVRRVELGSLEPTGRGFVTVTHQCGELRLICNWCFTSAKILVVACCYPSPPQRGNL